MGTSIDSMIDSYIVAEEDFPDQRVIIKENTPGDWVYVILEGQVKVKKSTPKGMITMAVLKKRSIFGEMALFDKAKRLRTATVVADGPVKLGVLDKERLGKEFESLSPQLRGLIKTLLSRLEMMTKKASMLAVE